MKKILPVLVFLCLTVFACIANSAVTILYPNENGIAQTWTPSPNISNYYLLVDEADANSPEGTDSTVYIIQTGDFEGRDELVALDNFTASYSTIDSVIAEIRTKKTGTPTNLQIEWFDGVIFAYSSALNITTSYAVYRDKRTTNLTGGSWTATILNSLQIGVFGSDDAAGTFTVTQMKVIVYYTVSATAYKSHTIVKDISSTNGILDGGIIK